MKDKLRPIERKIEILNTLMVKKHSTRRELAEIFNVSIDTIARDIIDLSKLAPIYTRKGKTGGIYILSEYRSYKNYLSKEDEQCLYDLMEFADQRQKRILCSIIDRFTLNEYQI